MPCKHIWKGGMKTMIKIEVKHTPDDKERAQSLSGHLMSFVYEGIVVQYIEVKDKRELEE